MKLKFIGATETVTGSKYLLTVDSKNILIDCGLFQGRKELRLRNWNKLPINIHHIDAVILTHAHIDHSGYIPLLVKNGFKGKIYCTPATKDLCSILLPDSGRLQEEEAFLANKYGYSKHKPAQPLYTQEDAFQSLKHFKTIDFDEPYQLFNIVEFSFLRAGHILGSAFISLKHQGTSLLFTGDMGRPHDPIMREPSIVYETDYLITESTYGDRLHETTDPQLQLANIINKTVNRGGSIIIPAFAVGRTQSLLYYLHQLKKTYQIPDIPVFLDSPMAINTTNLLCKYANEHKQSNQECTDFCNVATYINSIEESINIDKMHTPIIIIAASGMATGGRVLYHLRKYAPNPLNTILFSGYQASETRGARMINGEPGVKMLGQMVAINAEVEVLDSLSAHADYQEILNWLSNFKRAPKKIFITHGEPEAANSLKSKIAEKFNWDCEVPTYLQEVDLI